MPHILSPPKHCSNRFTVSVFALTLAVLPAPALAQETPADDPNPTAAVATTDTTAAVTPSNQQDLPKTASPASRDGFLPEPRIIGRAFKIVNRTMGEGSGRQHNGFFPEMGNMITGSGWISLGPGYRHWLLNDKAIAEGSAAVSWRAYKMAQGRFEFPNLAKSRVSVGGQGYWLDATQITYFGNGPETLDETRSEYRMKTTDVVGYLTVRPTQWFSIGERTGWLHRPELMAPAGTFKRGNPATQTIFPDDVAFSLATQPNYLHSEAFVTADTRNSRSYPSSGGVYRGSFAIYSDRDLQMFSFNRYEAEAAQFVPLADSRVVLAFHGWLVGTNTNSDQTVPFYMMPSLGGHNTIRAYTDFRFHDRNTLVLTAESRFAVMDHIDLAAFVDAGNLAAKVSDLNVDKRAYGVGLRLHSPRTTFARLDVAHGSEGWRFLIRTSDPLHLSRLSRRTAIAPSVP